MENSKFNEVIKCKVYIQNKKVDAVLDTGAAITIISNLLVKELNLPTNIANKTNLVMANNSTTCSTGKVNNLKICINNNMYDGEAVILENAAQELLLGCDWLTKHKVIVDLKNNILILPDKTRNNYTSLLPTKHTELNIKEYYQKSRILKCFAVKESSILPRQSTAIEVKITKKNFQEIPEKCIMITKNIKEGLLVTKGAFNISYTPKYILIANTGVENRKIEKGEQIAELEIFEVPKYQG